MKVEDPELLVEGREPIVVRLFFLRQVFSIHYSPAWLSDTPASISQEQWDVQVCAPYS